jgi:hypothetical protein
MSPLPIRSAPVGVYSRVNEIILTRAVGPCDRHRQRRQRGRGEHGDDRIEHAQRFSFSSSCNRGARPRSRRRFDLQRLLMMRATDAAIYFRTLKFSLVTEDSENSARPCRAEILNRGDGATLISARRRHESPKGILARAPPRVRPSMAASTGAPRPQGRNGEIVPPGHAIR